MKQPLTASKVLFTSLVFCLCLAFAMSISLLTGTADISVHQVIALLSGSLDADDPARLIILKIRLPRIILAAVVGFSLSLGGVIFQAVAYRVVPWLPLGLAFTFGLYGLFRKTVAVDSTTGTFLETLFLLPLTLAFLGWEMARGAGAFGTANLQTHIFLVLAGVVTAVPLVWFANGARLLPLSMVGFLQYLTPTLHLLIGVVLYREAFTIVNLGGFGLIWLGIAVYALSTALAGRGRAAAPVPR